MLSEIRRSNLDQNQVQQLGTQYVQLLEHGDTFTEDDPDFQKLENQLLRHFLTHSPEYSQMMQLLQEPNQHPDQIAKLVRQLRQKLKLEPFLGHTGSTSTRAFPLVIDNRDIFIDEGFLPMTDVDPVAVPYVYHVAPSSAREQILAQGILPAFCHGSGRGSYAYVSFQPDSWTEWAEDKDVSGKVTLFRIRVTPETTFYTWAPYYDSQGDGFVHYDWTRTLVSSNVLPLETIVGYRVMFDRLLQKKYKRSKKYSDLLKRQWEGRHEMLRPPRYEQNVWQYSPFMGEEVPPWGISLGDNEYTEILTDYIAPGLIEVV